MSLPPNTAPFPVLPLEMGLVQLRVSAEAASILRGGNHLELFLGIPSWGSGCSNSAVTQP